MHSMIGDPFEQEYIAGEQDNPFLPGGEDYTHGEAANVDIIGATRRVLSQAAKDRRPPPPMRAVPVSSGATFDSGVLVDVLGQGAGSFPMLRNIYARFEELTPRDNIVRVDTEDSFGEFVGTKPFLELDRRVRELRAAIEEHAHERKHGKPVAMSKWDAILGEANALATAKEQGADGGGRMVPLMLPPWADGKVHCWQEGDRVCCSMRIPAPDGRTLVATASTPIAEHAHDVMGYAARAGVGVVDVVGMAPHLACMMGAGSLLPQLASATPSLIDAHEASCAPSSVHKIIPCEDPCLAAIMGLAQMAQSGDPQACNEWEAMTAMARGDKRLAQSMIEGANLLSHGQHLKAKNR